MKIGKLSLGHMILFLASACGLYAQDFDQMVENLIEGSVTVIGPDSLKLLKEKNSELVILDAREESEYRVSHIENAIWVGYKDFDIKKIPVSKSSDIVVYCSVGYRSEKIGEKLQEAGFKNVNNLFGGIFGWKNQGYSVVDSNNNETQKVHAYSKSWGKWLVSGDKVYE